MATVTRVDGLRQLGQQMRGLKADVATKIARAATAAGATPIKKRAVRNIETSPAIDTGSLRDAVIVKGVPRGEAEYTSEHIVTVRGRGKPYNKKGQKVARAPHAHLIEFGTVNAPPEPFLGPAFDQEKGAAVEAIKQKLADRIGKVKP